MPNFRVKPLLYQKGTLEDKVAFVEELPKEGEPNILYKLPDGSIWAWTEKFVERETKVVDYTVIDVQPNKYYSIKFSDINVEDLLNVLNKAFKYLDTDPYTDKLETPYIPLSLETGEECNLYIVWEDKIIEDISDRIIYDRPSGTRNCFIYFDSGLTYIFSSSDVKMPIGCWIDYRTKQPIEEEQFDIVTKIDWTSIELGEMDLVYNDFNFLFKDAGKEIWHIDTVIEPVGVWKRLDNVPSSSTPYHNELENLDYEHSGHTGFVPSKLSILPDTPKTVSNDRLSLFISDGTPRKMTVRELSERIIRTADEVPSDLQIGQYLRLLKEEN